MFFFQYDNITGLEFFNNNDDNMREIVLGLTKYHDFLNFVDFKFANIDEFLNYEVVNLDTNGAIIFSNCNIGGTIVNKIGFFKIGNQKILSIYDSRDIPFAIEYFKDRDFKYKMNMLEPSSTWGTFAKYNVVTYDQMLQLYNIREFFKKIFNSLKLGNLDKLLILGMYFSYAVEYGNDDYVMLDEGELTIDKSLNSIYSCLVRGIAQCGGYSFGLKFLLEGIGIECQMVSSGNHCWNQIKLRDTWYNFDITNLKFFFLYGAKSNISLALTSNKTFFGYWSETEYPEINESNAKINYNNCSENFDNNILIEHINIIRETFKTFFTPINYKNYISLDSKPLRDLEESLNSLSI